jgi:hypothetical protein
MPPSGAFASGAHKMAACGLAVLPLGGDDGKKPLVRGWGECKHRPGSEFIDKIVAKHPDANAGIVCGLSCVTVLDIDDLAATDDLIRKCGDTPLKVQTPSGGFHLYYQHNGERCANLRSYGFKADVKAKGGIIAAPPSTRPDSGRSYTFIEGGWGDLGRLPPFQALVMAATDKLMPVMDTGNDAVFPLAVGQRNDALFRMVLRGAHNCATVDDILLLARSINEGFSPPLSNAEAAKTALSAWKYHREGRNWNGQEPHVSLPKSLWSAFDENPNALLLFGYLLGAHRARLEPFAVSPKAMAEAGVIKGWGCKSYRSALRWLLSNRFLRQTYKGGKGPQDPSKYTFGPAAP